MKLVFGTVTKAVGIEALTSIYFLSLTVLEKVVPIQGIQYPQKVCISREEKPSVLTKTAEKSKQGLLWLS